MAYKLGLILTTYIHWDDNIANSNHASYEKHWKAGSLCFFAMKKYPVRLEDYVTRGHKGSRDWLASISWFI